MSEGQITAGYYRGRAVTGSEQYGTTKNGNEQIAIDLDVPDLGRRFTTFLFFTENGAPYSVERLRACGWSGDDISNLAGIDKNEIDVQIAYEMFEGKQQLKVQIATGGGRITLQQQMDDKQKRAFAARMKGVLKNGDPSKPAHVAKKSPAPQREADGSVFGNGGDSPPDDLPF